jgi:hypothetical protein
MDDDLCCSPNPTFTDAIDLLCMVEACGLPSVPELGVADMVATTCASLRLAIAYIGHREHDGTAEGSAALSALRASLTTINRHVVPWAGELDEPDRSQCFAEWQDYRLRLEAEGGCLIPPTLD